MDEFDIPIFKKTYEMYKTFYSFRNVIPKQARYTLWQRCENLVLDILEGILRASQLPKNKKTPVLEETSFKLNFLRIFLRLSKEVKMLDNKKYILLQESIDEIGRMLGGWLRSIRQE